MTELNDDIHRIILSFLSLHSCNSMMLVDRRMSILASEDAIAEKYVKTRLLSIIEQYGQSSVGSLSFYEPFTKIEKDFRKSFISFHKQVHQKIEENNQLITEQIRKRPKIQNYHSAQQLKQSVLPTDKIVIGRPLKIVMIGEHAVGKTSLICRLQSDYFSDGLYAAMDQVDINFKFGQEIVTLRLWDTSGMEE